MYICFFCWVSKISRLRQWWSSRHETWQVHSLDQNAGHVWRWMYYQYEYTEYYWPYTPGRCDPIADGFSFVQCFCNSSSKAMQVCCSGYPRYLYIRMWYQHIVIVSTQKRTTCWYFLLVAAGVDAGCTEQLPYNTCCLIPVDTSDQLQQYIYQLN